MLSMYVWDPEPKTPTRRQGRPLGEILKEKLDGVLEGVGLGAPAAVAFASLRRYDGPVTGEML